MLHLCVVSLPTGGSSNDVRWVAEVDGLEKDLETIYSESCLEGRESTPPTKTRKKNIRNILAVGDFNFQPSSLGQGCDPSKARRRRWELLMASSELRLLNQTMATETPQMVKFPGRGQHVRLLSGSTRHASPPSVGRAIDLALASEDIDVRLIIHNVLQCGGPERCIWPACAKFCNSDHFLLQLTINASAEAGTALPVFHKSWLDTTCWCAGWKHIHGAIKEVVDLLASTEGSAVALRGLHARAESWVADGVACFLAVLGGVVRDAWVTPAAAAESHQRGLGQMLARQSEHQLQHALQTGAAEGIGQPELLNKCLRWLKPRKPQPSRRMRNADRLLDPTDTHQACRGVLTSQCPAPMDPLSAAAVDVNQRLRSRTAKARTSRGREQADHDITQLEVMQVISGWDASPAMPPDLMPRAALKCRDEGWCALTWQTHRICGPGRLARRPNLWRWSTMYTVYKDGSPRYVESFRLTFVRVQQGLLQEGIISRRLTPQVRSRIKPCQSGYSRGVEAPHMLLQTISDEAQSSSRRVWFILADFIKAFPSAWRALLLVLLADRSAVYGGISCC